MCRQRQLVIAVLLTLAIFIFTGCGKTNTGNPDSSIPADSSRLTQEVEIAVLYKEGFAPSSVPSGLTPEWIVASLNLKSIPARLVTPAEINGDFSAIINPYGEAYPKEAQTGMLEAQAKGITLINLAGTPFSKPDGNDDRKSVELFGMFAATSSGSFVTCSARTKFGSSALPSLDADNDGLLPYTSGNAVHAQYPSNERVLAYYSSIEDIDDVPTMIDGGPSIVLVRGEKPVLAIGYRGDNHPLNPANPNAASLLAELANICSPDLPKIIEARAYRQDGKLNVAATATGGTVKVVLTKNGQEILNPDVITSTLDGSINAEAIIDPAPAMWRPVNLDNKDKVGPVWLEIRLYSGERIIDVKRLPANQPEISIKGSQMLINGEVLTLKGMTPSHGFAPGIGGNERIHILKSDIDEMIKLGVNSIRNYGTWNDWYIDYTANKGLMVFDIIPQGWTWDFTDEMYESLKPWAIFMADRDRERHSVIGYVLANEILDTKKANVIPKLKGLNKIVKDIDPNRPTTYGAHPSNILTYGALEFTDIYGLDNYGFTWPLAIDTAGFAAYIKYCQAFLNKGRPMVLLEYGTNGWPGAMLAMAEEVYLKTTATKDVLERFQAKKFTEKFNVMKNTGVVGGYAFIWADEPGHTLPFEWYDEFVNRYKFPDDSIYAPYHPLNEEEYWGFNDIYRNPRLIVEALDAAYHGREWKP
jgi:hypothetical protein